jgi:CRISPR-associated protein Csm1
MNRLLDDFEYQSVLLAGLLHDIGKFWQRTGTQTGRGHPELSAWFVREHLGPDWPAVEDAVSKHHLPEASSAANPRLALTIALADWLSSGERRDLPEGETGQPAEDAVLSIFARLNGGTSTSRFPLQALAVNGDLRPSEAAGASPEVYARLWQEFAAECRILRTSDYGLLVDRILTLLEKYTLFVPSAAWESEADISLFHHLKSTAAIAACLYQDGLDTAAINDLLAVFQGKSESNRAVACLVGGDISGIQDFIYNVTSEGALNGLRGRSQYLQLLPEAIVAGILDKFGLTRANLLYCGGGHFYALVPSLPDVESRLEAIESDVTRTLLDTHQGRLGCVVAAQAVAVGDFRRESFGTAWDALHEKLARAKRRKFRHHLVDVLRPQGMGGEPRACVVCGTESAERDSENRCPMCAGFEELSQQLVGASILIERQPKQNPGACRTWRDVLAGLGREYEFGRAAPENEPSWLLNDTRLADQHGRLSGFRFVANHVPLASSGSTATLQDLANKSDGVRRWGVVRADVDNLGVAFKDGLGKDRSISRLSVFSYLLSYFFSARIQAIAQEDAFKDKIHLVYSGGDDLFAIGSWSALPEFAETVRKEFARFTSGRLSLSAGIAIAPSEKFPVYEAADMAGGAEGAAKEAGRNRLSLLDTALLWDELRDVREVKDKLVGLLNDGLPKSVLSVLRSSWEQQEQTRNDESGKSIFPIWRLLYALTRLKKRHENMAPRICELESSVVQGSSLHKHLDLIVRWAELESRSKEDDR